jgi:CRP/FNR family transcriptional regulator
MNTQEFLQTFPAFRSSPDTMLKGLLTVGRRQLIPGGKQIYHEGDACSAIAFILAGDVRVYKIGQTGREITLYEIGPG